MIVCEQQFAPYTYPWFVYTYQSYVSSLECSLWKKEIVNLCSDRINIFTLIIIIIQSITNEIVNHVPFSFCKELLNCLGLECHCGWVEWLHYRDTLHVPPYLFLLLNDSAIKPLKRLNNRSPPNTYNQGTLRAKINVRIAQMVVV